ncbi:MAG: hypothetical protein RIC35_06375 [Marinoscillum sp.]
MNIKNLNQAFVQIAEKKNELFQYAKSDQHSQDLKNELRELEQEFQYEFGSYIEEALFNVHDEFCPDNEVLKPIAYFAGRYVVSDRGENEFDVDQNEGIAVEADDFPGINARLVLVPGPTRLVLQGVKESFKEIVWVARQPLEA